MQLIDAEESTSIEWKEVLYVVAMVAVGLVVYLTGLYLDVLIELYGAIFGFVYLIFMPIYIHFTCLFKTKSSGSASTSISPRDKPSANTVQSTLAILFSR